MSESNKRQLEEEPQGHYTTASHLSFEGIHRDVRALILRYLDVKDVLALRLCSRSLCDEASADHVWRGLWARMDGMDVDSSVASFFSGFFGAYIGLRKAQAENSTSYGSILSAACVAFSLGCRFRPPALLLAEFERVEWARSTATKPMVVTDSALIEMSKSFSVLSRKFGVNLCISLSTCVTSDGRKLDIGVADQLYVDEAERTTGIVCGDASIEFTCSTFAGFGGEDAEDWNDPDKVPSESS